MLNGICAILFALCVYPLILIIQCKKKIELKSRIIYFIIHFLTALMISKLFFPIPIQREIVEQEVYYKQLQTVIPFYELYFVFSKISPSQTDILRILYIYIRSVTIPSFLIGIPLGFMLRLKIKKVKTFLFSCAVCGMLVEICKLILCLITGAQYLYIAPDNVLYIFLGAIIGALLLKLVRTSLKSMRYQSSFFIAMKEAIVDA